NADISDRKAANAIGRTTLRAVVQQANHDGGSHVVNFGAATTITLTGSFPSINVPLTINGRNSAGQRVEINGNGFGGGSTIFGGLLAFEQASGGSVVRSLVLNNSGTGIYLGTAGNSVEDCYLGTDTTGTLAHANYQGLVVT